MAAAIPIQGVGQRSAGYTRGAISLKLTSIHDSGSSLLLTAFVLRHLTSTLPSFVASQAWAHLQGLPLADPDFMNPRPIDLILGADSYGSLIEPEILKGNANDPIAQRTILGWIVLGPVRGPIPSFAQVCLSHCEPDINILLSKFWVQEEVPSESASTPEPEEAECERLFKASYSRDEQGRYTVRLPFKKTPSCLGESYSTARRCLIHLQQRLIGDPRKNSLYKEFLREYESLSHMVRTPIEEPAGPAFYLPHHGVFREQSATTKLRVVFNGSRKTSSGISLNDILHTGPKLQRDISDVLLWIRQYQFIFATDVAKMYRQIQIHPDDWDFQRILWIDTTNRISSYHLTTVTYGLSCAPFLAIRVMLQLVEDEGHLFPLAVPPLTNGRYVDDIFGGADTIPELKEIAQQLFHLCQRGCFPLQKWSANSSDVLSDILQLSSDSEPVHLQAEDPHVKLLGLVWDPKADQFRFSFQPSFSNAITKRTVLSETAQLFDPLGFISPVIVTAKILLQELWLSKLQWDDYLSRPLQHRWIRFRESLADLSLISISRWLYSEPHSTAELHGFSDASQFAMSAVVYLRVSYRDGSSRVTLVCSKTRVAPLKRLTIPRLELTAALLLSRLMSYVQRSLNLVKIPVFLWTDSSVTLHWITSHPSKWKEFVQNRVRNIQELTSNGSWRYVQGKENPADCASRGLTPHQLAKHTLWWHGPSWLSSPTSFRPTPPNPAKTDILPEQRPGSSFTTAVQQQPVWELVERYSSLVRLLRITATCQRAISRFKRVPHSSLSVPLTPEDLDSARSFWLRHIQLGFFKSELDILISGTPVPRSNSLATLTPFVDRHGILRVGGRLRRSDLDPETKHPPILPRHSRFSSLVVSDAHLQTLHGGTQSTLAYLRQSYWILGGRAPVRSVILHCTICARHRGLRAQQMMGQLPPSRVTPSRAFLHCGLDYAGPFQIKTWKARAAKTYKGYLAVFVCFSTSAIHLELVTDYSSEAFIAAYRRFSGRRGICNTLYSDCGTNFIGADASLKALFRAGSAEMAGTISALTNIGTKWAFNPPSAPHMGGKWEAAVKSAKHHLRRVLGETVLTYEEFTTLLAQVEAVLNSRPLCPLTDDPEDTSALTPGHFLIGEALTTVPEPSLILVAEPRLSRWQLIQSKLQHFWKRWNSEYLHRSLATSRWHHPSYEIQVGKLVLITDERLPPSKWPLARVVTLHPGTDGLTRVVTLRTAASTLTRPIAKLCVLPVHSSSTSVPEGGE